MVTSDLTRNLKPSGAKVGVHSLAVFAAWVKWCNYSRGYSMVWVINRQSRGVEQGLIFTASLKCD